MNGQARSIHRSALPAVSAVTAVRTAGAAGCRLEAHPARERGLLDGELGASGHELRVLLDECVHLQGAVAERHSRDARPTQRTSCGNVSSEAHLGGMRRAAIFMDADELVAASRAPR